MTEKETLESNMSENFGYKMEDVSIIDLKKEDCINNVLKNTEHATIIN